MIDKPQIPDGEPLIYGKDWFATEEQRDVVLWAPWVWKPWLGCYERFGYGTGTGYMSNPMEG